MMRGHRLPILALALILAAAGCAGSRSEREPAAARDAKTGAGGAGHAPAGVVPGSYEDWCDEHGVPESACTRCDPALVPAFKAVGDWDAEHGLPKSQCTTCDPTLKIVRPPKPEAD